MLRWLVMRVAACALALWLIVTLSFLMLRAVPGGPFGSDKPLPPAVLANLQRTFGMAQDVTSPIAGTLVQWMVVDDQQVADGAPVAVLQTVDGPRTVLSQRAMHIVRCVGHLPRQIVAGDVLVLRHTSGWEQYAVAMRHYCSLEFGRTFASQGERSVTETIAATFPVSLELGLYALALALVIGIGLGWLAALRPGGWLDHVSMTAALIAVCCGTLVLAPILLWLFGVHLRWLPWGGWVVGSLHPADVAPKVLPVVTLAIVYAAWFARLARAGMVATLQQPWVRAAQAKGMSPLRIVTVHAARAALLPVVSYLGPAIAAIVTGSVVVERVFAVPGMGQSFVVAALNRDYPLVMGTVVLYAALLLTCNLLVDIVYVWLDPRLRSGAAGDA